jgi:hypothetical protein
MVKSSERTPSKPRPLIKSCGTCNLCCKVYDVEDVGKKAGHLCQHTRIEAGCGIWGLHPQICQDFKCLWLKHDDLNGLWRPDVAGFVLRLEPNGTTLNIDVDPDRPKAWQQEPYYTQFKLWSVGIRTSENLVVVYAPEGLYVITPDEDLYLKTPKRGDILETGMEMTLFGPRPFARVLPAPKSQRTVNIRHRA